IISKGGTYTKVIRCSAKVFQFDLCDVINCGNAPKTWTKYDVYMCIQQSDPNLCAEWNHVYWNTNPNGWTAESHSDGDGAFHRLKDSLTLIKRQVHNTGHKHNPLILTVRNFNVFFLTIGVDVAGTDPLGLIMLNITQPPANKAENKAIIDYSDKIIEYDAEKLSPSKVTALETGFVQNNEWLNLMRAEAQQTTSDSCVVCAEARPNLLMVPTTMEFNGTLTNCIVDIMSKDNPSPDCKFLDNIYPIAPKEDKPPIFIPNQVKLTCIRRGSTGSVNYGQINSAWCARTIDVTDWKNSTRLTVARADVWWYCGRKTLHGYLAPNWKGKCGLVSLISPVRAGEQTRRKRSIEPADSPVYIDAIGIPRGIPNEYKLVNEIAVGFESILIFITPPKNAERINYVHYNVQRLSNFTRDFAAATTEQLGATSLTSYQNRVALDFLLADKGGVCSMFGTVCCTFIPNNTAPDGSLTRALGGLRAMSEELTEHSGIHNPVAEWFGNIFGKWQKHVEILLMPLLVIIVVLPLCGCCCIPCIRALCIRCMDSALAGSHSRGPPPPYQLTEIAPPMSASEPGGSDIEEYAPEDEDQVGILEDPWRYRDEEDDTV
uniref:Uncharacterized protein n=1 Tax=Salarias fasciatus TaxID=181472 RepID=A0A672G4E8_SALFA